MVFSLILLGFKLCNSIVFHNMGNHCSWLRWRSNLWRLLIRNKNLEYISFAGSNELDV
jgi:hypothetical protein